MPARHVPSGQSGGRGWPVGGEGHTVTRDDLAPVRREALFMQEFIYLGAEGWGEGGKGLRRPPAIQGPQLGVLGEGYTDPPSTSCR